MAKSTPKISLAAARDIPFNKLVLSQSNVRSVKCGLSIDELTESIARRGLIQSLHVRPVLDKEGSETGMYEVPAGGRRYRALELLVKQKRLAKTALVPCVIGDAHSHVLIDEISLIENMDRAPLHPLDQFRAFKTMRDKGMTEEAIAAAFYIDINVVKQRLRLASVSPELLDVYAADGMTLQQLTAFTISSDHPRQIQVWNAIKDTYNKSPYQIRRMLTETAVPASDKRALFVTMNAYQAAGGAVERDLFEDDDGGWLQDVSLLDRMVAERLKQATDEIAAEGWKWIEAAISFPYDHQQSFNKVTGSVIMLTDEEYKTREALRNEFDRLQFEYKDTNEFPDDVDQRLGEIEQALDAFEMRPMRYDPADVSRAGVFISLKDNGSLFIDRGYLRPEDDKRAEPGEEEETCARYNTDVNTNAISTNTVINIAGSDADHDDTEQGIVKPLPERLIAELTAYRSVALRNAVATNPEIAMTMLLHKLVKDLFHHDVTSGCLDARVSQIYFTAQPEDLQQSEPARAIEERHEGWRSLLSQNDQALWDYIHALNHTARLNLLAHCVSFGVTAVSDQPYAYGASTKPQAIPARIRQADRLSQATGLDLVATGWRPTVNNYLDRVTKSQILEAVHEGAGESAAQLIGHLKKPEMAKEAERLLANTGWLPKPLRPTASSGNAEADHDDGDNAIPAFLDADGDDDEADDPDEDEQAVRAAE